MSIVWICLLLHLRWIKYREKCNFGLFWSNFVFFFGHNSPPPQWPISFSFTRFLLVDYTQRRTTFGSSLLDEWSACRRDLYLTTHSTHNRHPCPGGIRTHNLGKRSAADPIFKKSNSSGFWKLTLIVWYQPHYLCWSGYGNLQLHIVQCLY